MEAKATVFVVDDDPAVLDAIANLVEAIGLTVEVFPSGEEFLDTCSPNEPACLVLDVRMPGMSGLELQRRLHAAGIELPVIMITGHGDVRMAVEAMKEGAVEFLEKPFRMQELCDVIQSTIRKEAEKWQRRQRRQSADRLIDRLTTAERTVLDLVVAGKTNKMIAEELGLSVRAIEDRRARMMKKLQVQSRAELIELVTAAHSQAPA